MTPRKKNFDTTVDDCVIVSKPDFKTNLVQTRGDKASLNAPLLWRILEQNKAEVVVHLHQHLPGLPQLPYAPAGTVRDSLRDIPQGPFEIENHGVFLLLNPSR